MHGKGLARLVFLVVTSVLAAGVTLGAMSAPMFEALTQGR
jgi:hypothetical protein